MLLGPSWKIPALSIPQEHPPGASNAGQVREGPIPFPALPGELRAPCRLLTGLQVPKSSSTMKTKTNPKAVLLEQSWSQVLDKAQEFLEQRGPLPALPCKSCRKALRNHPVAGAISLPASPSPPEPSPAAAGRAGRKGQGKGGSRMLWSTLDQQCPIPREGFPQGDAIPDFWGDQQLGAGILYGQPFHGQPAPGSNPTILPAPSQAQELC